MLLVVKHCTPGGICTCPQQSVGLSPASEADNSTVWFSWAFLAMCTSRLDNLGFVIGGVNLSLNTNMSRGIETLRDSSEKISPPAEAVSYVNVGIAGEHGEWLCCNGLYKRQL
ncbi:hypothetical protein DV515_00010622 [Chloebia gouldiae]|uniref:Uncharacterized protein n=1 Tax=Chloebia gouldiae TaxID=44316 RepID=A0A3L8S8P5_CHLGU|nr:hypothetical protein DV515_00010622 [Chloebia gouldiae]